MALDEATAYAIAAWQRLDDNVSDDLLRAVCGAFALVAVADGDLDERETARFLEVVRKHFGAFPNLDLAAIEQRFVDLTQSIIGAPKTGRGRALAEVACVAGREREGEVVRSAARVAMLADQKVDEREQDVLSAIDEALKG